MQVPENDRLLGLLVPVVNNHTLVLGMNISGTVNILKPVYAILKSENRDKLIQEKNDLVKTLDIIVVFMFKERNIAPFLFHGSPEGSKLK